MIAVEDVVAPIIVPTQVLPTDAEWIYYYQLSGGRDPWRTIPAARINRFAQDRAPRYVTALATTFDGQQDARCQARYFGDLYIDWDGKPEIGDLGGAIRGVQKFARMLTDLDVPLTQVRWYASGGRGFHAEIPLTIFTFGHLSHGEQRGLPAIYKKMLLDLFTDGMDQAIYSGLRGRMWRVPNVERENGRFKVPVSAAELLCITGEKYASLTSAPRPLPATEPPTLNGGLAALFAKAAQAVAVEESRRPKAVTLTSDLINQLPAGKRTIELVKYESLKHIETLLPAWFNNEGSWAGGRYMARNFVRGDRRPGSFFVWADGGFYDFACPDECAGGDLVALYAYLNNHQGQMEEAAIALAEQLDFVIPPVAPTSRVEHVSAPSSALNSSAGARQPANFGGPPSIANILGLVTRDFPPTKWVVQDLLPAGLTLFAAAPKAGKSWLALDVAVCVASGVPTMGDKRTVQGDVLYLALEDNERRLKNRFVAVAAARGAMPECLQYATQWELMGRGGTQHIEQWLVQHPNAALVVIDTLARIKDEARANKDKYEHDYKSMSALKKLSDSHNVAILIITHDRKAQSDDPLDSITGTKGLTGGADNTWILKKARGESQASLFVIGRDIEDEINYGLQWHKDKCVWSVEGTAADVMRSVARQDVLELLNKNHQPMAVGQVAEALGKDRTAAQRLLNHLIEEGCVRRKPAGRAFLYFT